MSTQEPKVDSFDDASARTKQLLVLKQSLSLVAPLASLLMTSQAPLLTQFGRSLMDEGFDVIQTAISRVLEENARAEAEGGKMRVQQIFAVRQGYDGTLASRDLRNERGKGKG